MCSLFATVEQHRHWQRLRKIRGLSSFSWDLMKVIQQCEKLEMGRRHHLESPSSNMNNFCHYLIYIPQIRPKGRMGLSQIIVQILLAPSMKRPLVLGKATNGLYLLDPLAATSSVSLPTSVTKTVSVVNTVNSITNFDHVSLFNPAVHDVPSITTDATVPCSPVLPVTTETIVPSSPALPVTTEIVVLCSPVLPIITDTSIPGSPTLPLLPRFFTKHSAKVVIVDILDELGQSVCNDIGPNTALYIHCDVTNKSDVENVVNMAIAKFGKLDVMINNAIVIDEPKQSILENDAVEFERVIEERTYLSQ
ncbi:hypothetical protein Ancab_002538 [Ancistrocladus abbreviatus]